MRTIRYLSPSAFIMFKTNREKFVEQYCLDTKLPRDEQSKAMALGSSFDAFAKNELSRCIFGGSSVMLGSQFHLETLFKKQVPDDDIQQWAWEEGGYLFLKYKDIGGFDALLLDLEKSGSTPIFEQEAKREVDLGKLKVPLRGFPDAYFTTACGEKIILDWKCNNYCGSQKKSPSKHYIIERPSNRHHKDVVVEEECHILLQNKYCFSEVDEKWATQLTMYSWMLGEPIVNTTILQIEQLLCQPGETNKPDIRAITYRGRTFEEFQVKLAAEIEHAWDCITAEHYFDDLTKSESDEKVKQLERHASMMMSKNPIVEIMKLSRKIG